MLLYAYTHQHQKDRVRVAGVPVLLGVLPRPAPTALLCITKLSPYTGASASTSAINHAPPDVPGRNVRRLKGQSLGPPAAALTTRGVRTGLDFCCTVVALHGGLEAPRWGLLTNACISACSSVEVGQQVDVTEVPETVTRHTGTFTLAKNVRSGRHHKLADQQ